MARSHTHPSLEFLATAGQAGRAIAGHDWSSHPIGDPDGWPVEFRTALGMVMNSGFPSFIAWGEDFHVFYNDPYVEILGTRPFREQGARLADLWPEAWDQVGPIAHKALAGESSFFEDRPFLIDRPGRPDQGFFTFSYSPINTGVGPAKGILFVGTETTEKVAATMRVKESERRLQGALDASRSIGTWAVDPVTNIVTIDERFARLFQLDAAQARGDNEVERFTNMIHDEDRDHVVAAISNSLERGEPYDVEYRIPQNDGQDVWVAVKGGMTDDPGKPGAQFAGIALDITERKNAEALALATAAGLAFQLEVVEAVRVLRSPAEIISTATAMLARHLGASRVIYGQVQSGNSLFIRHSWTAEGFEDLTGVTLALSDFGPDMFVDLRAGRVVANNNVRLDPRTAANAAAFEALGVHSEIVVPVSHAGELRLVVAIHRSEPHRWHDTELLVAQAVAQQIWLAAETAGAQAELRDQRDFSQSIFDTMGEGFTLIDNEWRFAAINEVGAAMTERPRSELLGRFLWDALPETAGTSLLPVYEQVRATGESQTLEYPYTPPSGRQQWIEIRPYRLADGQLAVFFRNITARKRMEEEIALAARRKDEFLAMLAHELRNPLAPIRAAADLLSKTPADEERVKKASAIISRQVIHLTSLVDDLLDVSRVTRGQVVLEKADVDLKRVVSDAVEQVRPLVEARRHHLSVGLPPESAYVAGDHKRLVQVLINLLNNAAKFTPEGGRIAIAMDIEDKYISVTVEDSGIGMSPEMAERAFALFAQAERTSDRTLGGLGIGLALVKSLVELHDGRVSAKSRGADTGSKFTVCLPRLSGRSVVPPGDEASRGAQSDQSLRILIVDDNEDAASMLAMFLEASGHAVTTEHSSREGLARAFAERPDVCLLDIGLPDMDGNELARQLRSNPKTADTLLIAVTGYGQELDRQSSAAAGFNHHLVKPLDPIALAGLLAAVRPR
ncbi:ATP-binding protein [Cognatilysobacter bugurensis]|uniref:histidine kinase n=1 Tax=Cognatilysobacter bugurensis TaxID=543356 RepID=A0A918SZL1_9GAMM|nr:ATP-binding protein [Lysobacter bugurensis]GHA76927.1 hypothetical protein GCM10007067_12780 [Lysobacter bugurensis]